MHLVATLRQLAQGGRAILTTIHQPSSRLYQMLDKLLLLSEGYATPLLASVPKFNFLVQAQRLCLFVVCKALPTYKRGSTLLMSMLLLLLMMMMSISLLLLLLTSMLLLLLLLLLMSFCCCCRCRQCCCCCSPLTTGHTVDLVEGGRQYTHLLPMHKPCLLVACTQVLPWQCISRQSNHLTTSM